VRTIRRPTWMVRLSNAALLDEFAAAVVVYDEQGDRPDIRKREELMRRKELWRLGGG
jgi:hypothetical protein